MNVRTLPHRKGKNWMRAATHCIHGHKFDQSNTSLNENGWRRCRTCNRERAARQREQSQCSA